MSEQSTEVKGFKNSVLGKVLFKIAAVAGLQDALDGKADASHTHEIGVSDVTGLQSALDGKADASHTHEIGVSDVTGLQSALDGKISKVTGDNLQNKVPILLPSGEITSSGKVVETQVTEGSTNLITSGGVHAAILSALSGSMPIVTTLPEAAPNKVGTECLYLGTTGTYEFGQSYKCISTTTPGQTLYGLSVTIAGITGEKSGLSFTGEQYATIKQYLASEWNVNTESLPAYAVLEADENPTIVATFYTDDSSLTPSDLISEIAAFFNSGDGAGLGMPSSDMYSKTDSSASTLTPTQMPSTTAYSWQAKYALKSELPSQS